MLLGAVAITAANFLCTEALLMVVHRVLPTTLVAAIVAERKRDRGRRWQFLRGLARRAI